jgi:hypothetical protein
MQPCTTLVHPTSATGESAAAPSLSLRLAQRAFAALIETPRRHGPDPFRRAQLAGAARRTLSALSADECAGLAGWLALQFASGSGAGRAGAQGVLARVDATLAAEVGMALAGVLDRLRPASHATVA